MAKNNIDFGDMDWLCDFLKINKRMAWRLVNQNQIPHVRLTSHTVRFNKQEIVDSFKNNSVQEPAGAEASV